MSHNPFSSDLEMDMLVLTDNAELFDQEDGRAMAAQDIIVYSRDWTIETIFSQIEAGNIDLNPEFQRRNAWNDKKKSSLIESYILGYPVPEIVLAEHPRERRKFIVIDGKQRLLAICGFLNNMKYKSWQNPKLNDVNEVPEINGKTFNDLKSSPEHRKYVRLLANADVRCTVISNLSEEGVLYDIFYRLNAGATPLSVQELRQVLYSGPFTKYLIDYTSILTNIHKVLKLDKPDNRLKDIECLLRVLAFTKDISNYSGNLKKFLDCFTNQVNSDWDVVEKDIVELLAIINEKLNLLSELVNGFENIGRRYSLEKSNFETRFNTVLFEVQMFFAIHSTKLDNVKPNEYIDGFSKLFNDSNFDASLSSSTKNMKEYKIRYEAFSTFHASITNGENIEYPWVE